MTDETWTPRRRRVLQALGASAAATGLAGCSGGGDDDDSSGDGSADDGSTTDDPEEDSTETDSEDDSTDDESDEEESEEERPDPLGDTAWPMGGFDAGFSNHHQNAAALDQPLTEDWALEQDIEFTGGYRHLPLVAGAGHLVTATPQGTVIAFDETDGTENWTFEMNERGDSYGGIALFDGVVYACARGPEGTDPKYALDAESGDVLWERDEGKAIDPLVYEGAVYGREWSDVVARNVDDGEELWRTERLDGRSNLAISDGAVFVQSTRTSGDWEIVALDAGSGDERWRSDPYDPDQNEIPTHVSAGGGSVYATNRQGLVVSMDVGSGATEWESTPYTGDEQSSSSTDPKQPPVIGDDHVFLGGFNIHALSKSDGVEQWAVGSSYETHDYIGFVDGQVFNMTDPGIVAHDPADGTELWSYSGIDRPECVDDFALTGERLYLAKGNCGGDPPKIIALGPE